MLTVVIFAGPSGGHLFPAVAFAEVFKARFPGSCLMLVTSRKGEGLAARIPGGLFQKKIYLANFPAPSGISLRTPAFLLKLLCAIGTSVRFLSENKAVLCVGFGSYASYAGIVAARWLKIPTLIHEQNLVPGKATRRLLKHADCVAVSFFETPEFFGRCKPRRTQITGLPIRRKLCFRAAKREFVPEEFEQEKQKKAFRILAAGGSQGSRAVNDSFVEALRLFDHEERSGIAVIHITGKEDFERVSERYRELGVKHETYPFFENMEDLYGRVDMAITRAGANTLFELALFQIPALIIPYPFAGEHQMANARYFEARGAVLLCAENSLTGDLMKAKIRELRDDPRRQSDLRQALKILSDSQAGQRLTDLAGQLIGRK